MYTLQFCHGCMVLIWNISAKKRANFSLMKKKSNKSWHWCPQSFSLMQSVVCAVQHRLGCLWEIVRAKAHYHNELSSAGAPLYCWIDPKCGHFSASNWCWGRQVPILADIRALRMERFAQNIFLQLNPPPPLRSFCSSLFTVLHFLQYTNTFLYEIVRHA